MISSFVQSSRLVRSIPATEPTADDPDRTPTAVPDGPGPSRLDPTGTPSGEIRLWNSLWSVIVTRCQMADDRYARRFRAEWPPILRAFLASLPPEGWMGTARELWDAVYEHRPPHGIFPGPNAIVREIEALPGLLHEAGLKLERRRTGKERTIAFVRVDAPEPEAERGRRPALACPFCACRLSYVRRTTLHGDAIHRRRECEECGRQYTSKELTSQKLTDVSLLVRAAIESIPPTTSTRV